MIVLALLWIGAGALALATLAPLSKQPFGAIRGLAFPRIQFCFLAFFGAVVSLWWGAGAALPVLYGAIGIAQLAYIIKFTPIWKSQSQPASDDLGSRPDRHVSFLSANVKKSNKDYARLIDLIRHRSCDVVMAIEVDAPWIEALEAGLGAAYPHWVRVPMENGYGLCLMSRYALADVEVRELVTQSVPSIRATVTLPVGSQFRLYVVHPEPPVMMHDTKGRDGEIGLIGIEARDDPLPSVVSGDLNDVAWSTTTRRFQRLSGLLDPRVGRGFYNTFHAAFPMFRWPLDHLFHDPRFRLLKMERLPKIGSDHFAMLFALALAEEQVDTPSATKEDPTERREMKAMVKDEAARDRTAIGSDWED